VQEEIAACNEADRTAGFKGPGLACGLYADAIAEDEQTAAQANDPDVGNFVIYRRDCSYIAATNLPSCAFGVLSAAIEAGEPLPSPTTVFTTNICAPVFNPTNVLPFIPFIPCIAGACDSDDPTSPE